MGALSKILRNSADNGLLFWCPGCDMAHRIQHGSGSGPRWGWNGNAERPTFTPSVLVSWEQAEPPGTTPELRDKILRGEIKQVRVKKICHSFVTDGRIQFLGDSTHALAGQTVDLPEWPEDWG